MDSAKRLTQFLSSTAVIPNYSQKWSAHGRMLKHQAMGDQMKLATKKTTVLDVGQPNTALTAITGLKLQTSNGEEVEVEKDLLERFTQYSFSDGIPELRRLLLDFQRAEHNPPQMKTNKYTSLFDLCVTCGSTDALQSCIKSFMDTEDTILMEDVNYVNFIFNLKTHGMKIQGVAFDDKGMLPSALEETLTTWDQKHPGKRMPKLIYTVTSSSNPIGYNWSLNRMLEIYEICRKYDIMIMDDGAYHFLQYGQRPRSFQSLDIDGRVIRFDTVSKTIGAGYRIGWVSGPRVVIEKFAINHELTCVHPSVLAQVVLYSVLKKWGTTGFETRVKNVANFYRERADCIINACEKYLPDFATWTVPRGGMFTWISFKDCVSGNSDDIVKELRENHDIQVIGGNLFNINPNDDDRSIRVCYSTASHDAMTKAIKSLADVLQKRTTTRVNLKTGSASN